MSETNEKEAMDQKIEDAEVVEVKETKQEEPQQIEVDQQTAFQMKIQEFDIKVATAKAQAAQLEKEKLEFIYNNNVQLLTEQYKQNQLKKEIEQEALKRANQKK